MRRDGREFKVEIEEFRDTPRGPHPISDALVIFKPEEFERVVPYLMLNREGLDVLVHPLTTDAVEDHSSYAIWLGNPVELKLHTLPRGRGGQRAERGKSLGVGASRLSGASMPAEAQGGRVAECSAIVPDRFLGGPADA